MNFYTFDDHVTQHSGLQNHQDGTARLKDVPQFGNFELDATAIERWEELGKLEELSVYLLDLVKVVLYLHSIKITTLRISKWGHCPNPSNHVQLTPTGWHQSKATFGVQGLCFFILNWAWMKRNQGTRPQCQIVGVEQSEWPQDMRTPWVASMGGSNLPFM